MNFGGRSWSGGELFHWLLMVRSPYSSGLSRCLLSERSSLASPCNSMTLVLACTHMCTNTPVTPSFSLVWYILFLHGTFPHLTSATRTIPFPWKKVSSMTAGIFCCCSLSYPYYLGCICLIVGEWLLLNKPLIISWMKAWMNRDEEL